MAAIGGSRSRPTAVCIRPINATTWSFRVFAALDDVHETVAEGDNAVLAMPAHVTRLNADIGRFEAMRMLSFDRDELVTRWYAVESLIPGTTEHRGKRSVSVH
ncbi:hypothetical protein [Pseudomonas sp. COR18]|uniref:hypothetical protein n=1 Tax=Pseudomonas sp. COR18 TaxID=3399680 RepID=UPI003B007518